MPKLKLDDDGKPELDDGGHLLVIHDDGKEVPTDVLGLIDRVGELNAESAGRRKKISEIEEKLKSFEGLDADKARKALKLTSDLDAKKLVDAGKVDELREQAVAETKSAYELQLEELRKAIAEREEAVADREAKIRSLTVGGYFRGSKLVREKTIFGDVPDAAEAYFGSHFEPDGDGEPLAYWDPAKREKPVMSQQRPGEPARGDEALQILLEKHPQAKSFFRSNGAEGGNATGGDAADGGGKTMDRAAFERLDAHGQMKFIQDGGRPV